MQSEKLFRQTKGSTAQAMKAFGDPNQIEKHLALGLATSNIQPGMYVYDKIMRTYIKDEFGVDVTDLTAKWSNRCWYCHVVEEDGGKLKSCKACKVAKYCR